MKTFLQIKKNNAAFTLIELLVVIAIIGMLTSVVFASLNQARVKARDAKRKADLADLSQALELFYSDYGVYPCGDEDDLNGTTLDSTYDYPTSSFLDGIGGNGGNPVPNCIGNPTFGLFTAGVLSSDPFPAAPDLVYVYKASHDRQRYILYVHLEADDYYMTNDGGCDPFYYEVGPGLGTLCPD